VAVVLLTVRMLWNLGALTLGDASAASGPGRSEEE
jgi:hypothetical protein